MTRMWKRIRQVFIFLCFVFLLFATVNIFKGMTSATMWSGLGGGTLVGLESLAILLYGLSLRPRHSRWIWRLLPIIVVATFTAAWLYAGGLAGGSSNLTVGTLLATLCAHGMMLAGLYFMIRLGYSPKLPPERFSVRVAVIALLATAFITFQQEVPVFAPRIRVTHDYLPEYNALTRPADFDPRQNAATAHKRLLDQIPPVPDGIKRLSDLWPGDMNDTEMQTARNWTASSEKLMPELMAASRKPYYWVERYALDKDMMPTDLPELNELRALTFYLLIHAKQEAYQGNAEAAFDEILTAYAMEAQWTGPRPWVEQQLGCTFSDLTLKAGFQVVSRSDVNAALLRRFQERLADLAHRWDNSPDLGAEKLVALDWIQRTFSDDGNGTGCISRRRSFRMGYGWTRIDRADTVRLLDELLLSLRVASQTTPWQCRKEGHGEFKAWEQQPKMALRSFVPGWTAAVRACWRLRTETAALVTTLAILRYQRDRGSLPESLDEVVGAGYLDALPTDPFGGRPLTYKRQGDDFIFYSYAQDLDDGGTPSDWGRGDAGGDQVFWPEGLQKGTPQKSNH